MFASLRPFLQLCGTNSLSGRGLWMALACVELSEAMQPSTINTQPPDPQVVCDSPDSSGVQVFRWTEVQACFRASGWCLSMEVICSPQSPQHQPRALRGNCTQIQNGQPVFAFEGLQLGSRFLRNVLPIVLVLILCHLLALSWVPD